MARRFGLSDVSDIAAVKASCIRLHNSGAWDLLNPVEGGEIQALADGEFFMASHFLGELVPELETDLLRLVKTVEALVARGGNDLASNQPNSALRAWCARDPARARSLMDAARAGDPNAGRNLTFALEAQQSAEEARRFLAIDDDVLKLGAVTALGRIPDPDAASRRTTLASFGTIADGANGFLKANLLCSTAFLLSQDGAVVGELELDLLRRLTSDPDEQVVHASAQVIWAQRGARRPEVFPLLLQCAGQVSAASKGSVCELDNALRALFEAGYQNEVIDFVRDMSLGTGDLALTELKGFLRALRSGPMDVFARASISWLLTGETRLCEALAEALGPEQDEAAVIAAEDAVQGLSDVEQIFVCRKAIAWFFVKPRTAASVLVSVLRACDEQVGLNVQRLLVSPLLINYGGLRDYLAAIDSDDAHRGDRKRRCRKEAGDDHSGKTPDSWKGARTCLRGFRRPIGHSPQGPRCQPIRVFEIRR